MHGADAAARGIRATTGFCPRRTPSGAPARVPYPSAVDISIGITNSPREISFESSQSAAEVQQQVAEALDAKATYLTFTDAKGKLFIVPTASLAYLEVGSESSRRVGFVA